MQSYNFGVNFVLQKFCMWKKKKYEVYNLKLHTFLNKNPPSVYWVTLAIRVCVKCKKEAVLKMEVGEMLQQGQ